MEIWRPPTEPIVQRKVSGMSGGAGAIQPPGSPTAQRQGLIASVGGWWSGCEVWAVLTDDWNPCTLELVGVQGPSRATLDRKVVRDATGVIFSGGGTRNVSLFSSYGRPAAFEVIGYNLDGAVQPATFYMRLWPHCEGVVGDRSGAGLADSFAHVHQQVNFTGSLLVGDTILFAPPADLGRTNITRIEVTTDDATPQLLELFETVAGVPILRASWFVSAASPVKATYVYPLAGNASGQWSVTLSGLSAGATMLINATGYQN